MQFRNLDLALAPSGGGEDNSPRLEARSHSQGLFPLGGWAMREGGRAQYRAGSGCTQDHRGLCYSEAV